MKFIKKIIAKKYVLLYLVIFFLFKFAFSHFINPYYIQDKCATPYPIDVRMAETCKWADTGYLVTAKQVGYDRKHYYYSFLPADLIFPIFYSLLFLSTFQYCDKYPLLRKILTVFVVAGWLADWSEDTCFAFFLSTPGNGLASVVAFFTSIKTILIILNLLVCIFFLAKAFFYWLADAIPCEESFE